MIVNRRMTNNILLLCLLANILSCCTDSSQITTQPPKPTLANPTSNVTPTKTIEPTNGTSAKETPDDQQLIDFDFPILFSFKYYEYDTSDILGRSQIYDLDLSGVIHGQLPRYSDNLIHYTDPAWSPDCQNIAFTMFYRNEQEESYEVQGIMNLETQEIFEFSTSNRLNHSPSWSNDGERIVFTALGDGISQIYIYDVDTESITQLTNLGFNYDPDWSPTNGQIVFVSENEDMASIHIINADGSGQREIVPGAWGSGSFNDPKIDSPYSPRWSPDGMMIAFQVREEALQRPVTKIYIADANGSNPRRLVEGDRREDDPDSTGYFIQWESDPVWSPDGKEILFTRAYLPTNEVQLCYANVETGTFRCPVSFMDISVQGLDWCHSNQEMLDE